MVKMSEKLKFKNKYQNFEKKIDGKILHVQKK